MNIKGTEDSINQIDSLLTTFKKVLKKHWAILLLILIGTGIYYLFTAGPDEVSAETEQVDQNVGGSEQAVQPVDEEVQDSSLVEEVEE